MISEYVAYRIGTSVGRRRAYDELRYDPDYQVFEFVVFMRWAFMVAVWPVHLCRWLYRTIGNVWVAISVGSLLVILGIALPVGYVLVGLLYASVWLALFLEEGRRAEEAAEDEVVIRFVIDDADYQSRR